MCRRRKTHFRNASKTVERADVLCYNITVMAIVRPYKGKSLWEFPADYTVVDIETNGLSSTVCEIIEISAVRYRNCVKAATFSTLIKPSRPIDAFITNLTGITDDMVKDAPGIVPSLIEFENFVGTDIILGYNVNFDVNFLYDNMVLHLGRPLKNDFMDVLRLTRKALPALYNHKQTTVAAHLGISVEGAHRAEADCIICNAIYNMLK